MWTPSAAIPSLLSRSQNAFRTAPLFWRIPSSHECIPGTKTRTTSALLSIPLSATLFQTQRRHLPSWTCNYCEIECVLSLPCLFSQWRPRAEQTIFRLLDPRFSTRMQADDDPSTVVTFVGSAVADETQGKLELFVPSKEILLHLLSPGLFPNFPLSLLLIAETQDRRDDSDSRRIRNCSSRRYKYQEA